MLHANEKTVPRGDEVLTRALLRMVDNLSISQKDLAKIVGVSSASISRLGKERTVAPDSKEGELALLLLRMYRSLDSIVGGSRDAALAWFRADNRHLGGVPAELVMTVTGLSHVAEYLDAMRGRL